MHTDGAMQQIKALMMWDGRAFSGAKVAIFVGDGLISYKRDQKQGIPFPGMWDLPGGGREGDETPAECVQREVKEEFGLTLDLSQFLWQKHYPSGSEAPLGNEFFVAFINTSELDKIIFGSEGECWQIVPANDFTKNPDAVPQLRNYVIDYLNNRHTIT
jgi:8-oxo-dGTP diphosphatase